MVTPTSRPCVAVLVLASLVPVFASPNGARYAIQSSSSDGLRLLHKMQSALGGANNIEAVRDYEEMIRAEAWDSRGGQLGEVRKRTRWIRPNVLRLDQIGPRGTYVLYFDGASGSGWEILPDLRSPDPFKTTGTAVALAGGELEFAKRYLTGFELIVWLADRMHGYTVSSPGASVLRIEHDGSATDFTLDPATGLPIKSAGVSLADPDRPVSGEMRYEAWREISGVRFPTHRVNYLSGMKRGEVFTSVIHLNTGLDARQLAAKPADFTPEISRR